MRYKSYTLRGLLILVSIAALPLAAVRWRAGRDQAAGAIIDKYHCVARNSVTPPAFAYRLPQPLARAIWPRYLNATVMFWGGDPGKSPPLHDTDLCELSRLEHLCVLVMGPGNADVAGPITDAGVRCLSRCRELSTLSLAGSQLTDAGLEAVARIRTLENLSLKVSGITDDGLRHLARLPSLVRLWLEETAITDRAIPVLASLESVRVLYVGVTRITPEGADRLRKLMPKTMVFGPSVDPLDGAEVPPEAVPYLKPW